MRNLFRQTLVTGRSRRDVHWRERNGDESALTPKDENTCDILPAFGFLSPIVSC